MNHNEIRKRLLPFLLAFTSALVSYALTDAFESKTWSNLAMIGLIDFTFLWMISIVKIDHDRKVFMCCVISIMIVIFTIPYSIISYLYIHSPGVVVDFTHNIMYEIFHPASVVTSFLLIIISVLPKGIIHGISNRTRINYHLGFFCHRVKISLYNSKKGSR